MIFISKMGIGAFFRSQSIDCFDNEVKNPLPISCSSLVVIQCFLLLEGLELYHLNRNTDIIFAFIMILEQVGF